MIILTFLDHNIFNVLKYIIIALTISYASDIFVQNLLGYCTTRELLKKGWVQPPHSVVTLRLKRGFKLQRAIGILPIVFCAFLFTMLELALELSTNSKPIWTTKQVTLQISNHATNIQSLSSTNPFHILKIRDALQRVEHLCFNLQYKWYHPISFHIPATSGSQGLGDSAKCYNNYSQPINATQTLQQSSFMASELVNAGMWNKSEIRLGRDVDYKEIERSLPEDRDIRVGPLEKYSFLSVNFSDSWYIEGSVKQMTNFTEIIEDQKLWLGTGMYKHESGIEFECLILFREKQDGKTVVQPEGCLLPTSSGKVLMGLYDDINGTKKARQLVISTSFSSFTTFRDLNALKASTFNVGKNSGQHTYREISVLTVMSSRMIEGIPMSGFQNVTRSVADKLITVPTINEWGLILLSVSTALTVLVSLILKQLHKKLPIEANLSSAHGIATHWLWERSEVNDRERPSQDAILMLKKDEYRDRITISPKSEII